MQISALSIAPLHHSKSLSASSLRCASSILASRSSLPGFLWKFHCSLHSTALRRFSLQIPKLAQQTFLAGEIVEIRSSVCFSCFRSSCSQLDLYSALSSALLDLYNLQRRGKSFHFSISLFLHFSISPHTPSLLTPPFCPSSLSSSFLLPSCFQLPSSLPAISPLVSLFF